MKRVSMSRGNFTDKFTASDGMENNGVHGRLESGAA